MSVISGVASVALLAMVNQASGRMGAQLQHPSLSSLILYCIAFFVFFVADRYALSRSATLMEDLLKRRRLRVVDRLRRADLSVIERIDRGELYTKVSQEPNQISQTFQYIVNAMQQVVMLVFCLTYIAWVSLAAFIVIMGAAAVLVSVYQRLRRRLDPAMGEVMMSEAEVVHNLDDVIDGFKEIRINSRKNDGLFQNLESVSEMSRKQKVSVAEISVIVMTYGNLFLYALLGAVVFVLPHYVAGFSGTVTKMTAVTLFAVGPLTYVVTVAPLMARANLCLQNLSDLEERLGVIPDAHSLERAREYGQRFSEFCSIDFAGISYTYHEENGMPSFSLGPLDVSIKRGEVIFLVGGNGSGKSTLLRLLTGLYACDTGTVKIDGLLLEPETRGGQRELYSCIFADFHLFDRLYGMSDVEVPRVTDILKKMQLDRKVTFQDGRFSTLNLSTGQRKRLALVEALLEDKPIHVFDEWAADQDVHFRRIFYEEILSELKAAGKTIIAATHDDRYWHLADRLIRLDAGLLVDEVSGEKGTVQ